MLFDGHGVVGVSAEVGVCRLMSVDTSDGVAHRKEEDWVVGGVERSEGSCAGTAHRSLELVCGDGEVGGVDRSLGICAGAAHNSSLTLGDTGDCVSPETCAFSITQRLGSL